MNRTVVVMILAITGFIGAYGIPWADETRPAAMEKSDQPPKAVASLYDQGVDASNNNDFQKALPLFEEALRKDPNNPDVLNMLAHSQREIGMIDESLVNYKKAIELRPRFPEAHEYLGEAYIQAALREVETLKNYGNDGKEELEDLSEFFKDAAGKI